jgi:hypothetical protein
LELCETVTGAVDVAVTDVGAPNEEDGTPGGGGAYAGPVGGATGGVVVGATGGAVVGATGGCAGETGFETAEAPRLASEFVAVTENE